MKRSTKKRCGESAIFVLCALLVFIVITDPYRASEQVRRGLSLCAHTLIPSLFPFLVISAILVRSGAGQHAARAFGAPMKRLFGIGGAGAAAFLLGILCGFPVGAQTSAALFESGELTKKEAEYLLPLSSYPSAPFMIFAVGEGMFGCRTLGVVIWISCLISGIICGIASRRFLKNEASVLHDAHTKPAPLPMIFTEAVVSAAGSMLSVCAFVVFFTCTVGCISGFFGDMEITSALLFSFFELSSGAAACAAVEQKAIGAAICAAGAGWSGISVLCQIFSLTRTQRCPISLKSYTLSKAASSVLCAAITLLSIRIFPSALPQYPPSADAFLGVDIYPHVFIAAFDIFFLLSGLFYLAEKLDIKKYI